MLMGQIPKQIGMVEYDDSKWMEPPKVAPEHRDFYLETAGMLVEANSDLIHNILENFPRIVKRHGIQETKRVMSIAAQIKDKDFPGEHNVVIFYTGKKAGHTFAGDEGQLDTLVEKVEERYKQ